MLVTINECGISAFVRSNAERDANERGGVKMYIRDPLTETTETAYDGEAWLVDKPSVEPSPE